MRPRFLRKDFLHGDERVDAAANDEFHAQLSRVTDESERRYAARKEASRATFWRSVLGGRI